MTSKIKLLKERLGDDLKNFSYTKWYLNNKRNWIQDSKLKIKLKHHPNEDDVHKYNDSYIRCYCETPIQNHYLIQHNETKEFYFVGSVCIHQFNKDGGTGLKRTCIDCYQPNRCHSLRCKNCRIECKIHKEYHDDNSVCKCCISCSDILTEPLNKNRCNSCFIEYKEYIKKQMARKPSFKSKYKRVYDMFIDSGYMDFLNKQTWFRKKYEYDLYQTYLELKKLRQPDK